MMKRTVGAGGVFLAASGSGVSESIAVGALGVALSLGRFLDLEHFENRKRAGRRIGTSSGLTQTTTKVASLESLAARSLLRYRASPIMTAFAWWMKLLIKVKSCSSSSGRTWVGIE